MALSQVGPRELVGRLGDWQPAGSTLYEALAVTLERMVRAGELAPDTRLPAERRLAEQLQVSRGTVMAAYEALRDRGLVATRHGSGTVVLRSGSPISGPREAHLAATLRPDSVFRGLLTLDPDTIDLRGATWIGTDDIPEEPFGRAFRQLRAERETHGYNILGLPALREAIADHLTCSGLETTTEQVLVTTGAQQALSLIAQLLIAVHDRVVVESSTYPGALEILAAQHARLVPTPIGPAGPELGALHRNVELHTPRMLYLVPSVHNPTGTVMPGAARARLGELANGWQTIVVDDRSLADTQIDGTPPPPLATYVGADAAERFLTVGSLSKMIWGGLRIGWIRAPGPILSRLAKLKAVTDLGTPVASQLIAANILADRDRVFAARRRTIRHRMDVLERALQAQLPEWRWTTPAGGLCLWVDLGGVPVAEFCHVAARHGVGLSPGSTSSPEGAATNGLRLPYGQRPETLREAVDRLAAAWQEYGSMHSTRLSGPLSVVV